MDAQLRSDIEPRSSSTFSFSTDALPSAEADDYFPTDLSAVSECRLVQLSDALFVELDSEMPDLRATERYQAVCDEFMLRQISSGVA